ncbi:MAG: hypothetical protein ABW019_17585 [Chitinophagaceae bacterium]
MEVKGTIRLLHRVVRLGVAWLLLTLVCNTEVSAQPATTKYSIKNGRMFITLDKQISELSLDSFIIRYALYDLPLQLVFRDRSLDTLKKMGWKVEVNNNDICVISKPLGSADNIANPAGKILLTEKQPDFSSMFPVESSSVWYGYNRFRNKFPFAVNDSVVTFFMRGNQNAGRVILSGSFVNWSPDGLLMTRTDSGWIVNVKLGPGKYWYKFIIDGDWRVDKDNQLVENDGLGNDNSVFFKANTLFKLTGYTGAKRVYLSGSFNNWNERELLMTKTATGWQLPLYLADGTHTYRFVADGKWFADPANPDRFPNEYKEFNSVIRKGKPYLFQLDGYPDARQVILSGSFNGWRKDELFMTKTATGWELPYTLGPGNYAYNFIVDGKVAKPANTSISKDGDLYFVIAPNYTFRLKGHAGAREVYLAGDFNSWSPNTFAMRREGDDWVFAANLSPGKHLYKFVVDGNWIIDPGNKLWEQNEHSTGNSVIWIEKK